ncbi:MAG: hypothetical protein DDT23_00982 [candidate division WS2 bacterium]|nr:hypothetical protein [Candidatus Lithacetigena glycinireducens]
MKDVDKLAMVIVLGVLVTLLYQTIISTHLYRQNRILTTELVRLRSEIRNLQSLQMELNQDLSPVIYFLEQVTEMQRRILEREK